MRVHKDVYSIFASQMKKNWNMFLGDTFFDKFPLVFCWFYHASEVRSGENICLLTGATDSALSFTCDPRVKITISGKQLVNSDEMSLALKLDSISVIWLRVGYTQVDTKFILREWLLCQRCTQDCGFYNYIDYSGRCTSSTWLEEDCHKISFHFGVL